MNTENNSPNTLMCILSYFGILALIPYFGKKEDAYIQWHAKQGLLVAAGSIVISFVLAVLSMVPGIGIVASLASMLFSLLVIALSVFCMVQACNGRKWTVPGIGGFLGS